MILLETVPIVYYKGFSKLCLLKAEKEGLELTGLLFEPLEPARNMFAKPTWIFFIISCAQVGIYMAKFYVVMCP